MPSGPTFKRPGGRYAEQYELRTYHVLLFIFLSWLSRALMRKWPVLPYQHIEQRIERVLESLSSSVDEESAEGWVISQYIPFGPKAEQTRMKRTAPLDSRTVEIAFLSLLRDIHFASIALPLAEDVRLNLPAAEIIFVFDELDKASLELPGRASARARGDKDEREDNEEEPRGERHLAALMRLFAELKNILSSASARFFFVGGRELHDAWLADTTARQPLLTRIFDDEVYLPSLLTDEGDQSASLTTLVERYLKAQHDRAARLLDEWKKVRHGPWLGIWRAEGLPPAFVRRPVEGALDVKVRYREDAAHVMASPSDLIREGLVRDLTAFLAYRSGGNVKRLREIIESFLHPSAGAERGTESDDHEHEMVFSDEDIHRIQLLAEIFRGMERVFRSTPTLRDDKIISSLIYISNTLLKFHRHAFNPANFERIDEVVDVHRAPEIRSVIHELLGWWSGWLLRPVHNGLFTYRFRSELAQELRFAARVSEEEMAALHFALDESGALKELYRQRLDAAGETPSSEMAAALGELHDLDGEYDSARYYYHVAAKLMDEKLQIDVFGGYHERGDPKAFAALYQLLEGEEVGKAIVCRRLPWVTGRLRLMLLIGLTYEHEKSYDRALIEYKNAGVLASVLLDALRPTEDVHAELDAYPHLATLRLSVQPALAELYAAEKAGHHAVFPDKALAGAKGLMRAWPSPARKLVLADLLAHEADLAFFRCELDLAEAGYQEGVESLEALSGSSRNKMIARLYSSLSDVHLARVDLLDVFEWGKTTPELGAAKVVMNLKELGEGAREGRRVVPPSNWPAILCAVAFLRCAVETLVAEGDALDAAAEALRMADNISRLVWWRLRFGNTPSGDEADPGNVLLDLARSNAEKADDWWSEGLRDPIPGSKSREPWTSLEIVKARLDCAKRSFPAVVARAGGESGSGSMSKLVDNLRTLAFPMVSRLRGLSLLLEAATGTMTKGGELEKLFQPGEPDVVEMTHELLRNERAYRSRTLFTPLDLGAALAAVAGVTADASSRATVGREEIAYLARAHLLRSARQVSQRQAYQEVLSDMHYLADDFNEPRIRSNHALQSAARRLGEALQQNLKNGLRGQAQKAGGGAAANVAGAPSALDRRPSTLASGASPAGSTVPFVDAEAGSNAPTPKPVPSV